MDTKGKWTARIVGALFLIAMVASLAGAGLIEVPISAPDFLSEISGDETTMVAGVLLELTNGMAVIGIAFLMFPMLKKLDEALAIGYVAFRIVEACIIFAALIIPLVLIAVSQDFSAAGAADGATYALLGNALVAVRAQLAGKLLGIFFSLGALIFFSLLYRSKAVPRFITIWGLIATVLVGTWNLSELAGYHIEAGLVFGLPIIVNEIVLGVWLIAKGFDAPAAAPETARPAITAI